MKALLEDLRMDAAIVMNSTSSVIYSQSFSMAGCHKAAAVIQQGWIPGSTVRLAVSTGFTMTMKLLGGDATTVPASMSSISGAAVSIGTSSTSGLIKGAHAVDIAIHSSAAATIASAVSLEINGITFQTNSSASAATAHNFLNGIATVVAVSLTTVLKVAFPNMNVTHAGTGDTAVVSMELVDIKPDTSGIYVKTTGNTTITGISVYPTKAMGIITLTPGKLVATASSFTNFCVRVSCTDSSIIPLSVMVFRDPVYAPSNLSTLHTIV